MKKIAILQSNYIPWKGYFDMIAAVNEFIIYDEVQFTKNDWRNRNKIKTPNGVQWLTIPVRQEHLDQKICETRVSDQRWADKHWKTLKQNYSRTPGFAEYGEVLAEIYAQAGKLEFLSDINLLFIRRLCGLLNIGTTISLCSDYSMEGDRIERLVNLCRQTAASVYISGPAARAYLDERAFAGSGIQLEWMDYSGYNPYPQPYGALEHGVSVVDLLFSVGAASPSYMKFRS